MLRRALTSRAKNITEALAGRGAKTGGGDAHTGAQLRALLTQLLLEALEALHLGGEARLGCFELPLGPLHHLAGQLARVSRGLDLVLDGLHLLLRHLARGGSFLQIVLEHQHRILSRDRPFRSACGGCDLLQTVRGLLGLRRDETSDGVSTSICGVSRVMREGGEHGAREAYLQRQLLGLEPRFAGLELGLPGALRGLRGCVRLDGGVEQILVFYDIPLRRNDLPLEIGAYARLAAWSHRCHD